MIFSFLTPMVFSGKPCCNGR